MIKSGKLYYMNLNKMNSLLHIKPKMNSAIGRAYFSSKFMLRIRGDVASIKDAGTWKEERIITSSQATNISVKGSSATVLNFCDNNYLGLSSHPRGIIFYLYCF